MEHWKILPQRKPERSNKERKRKRDKKKTSRKWRLTPNHISNYFTCKINTPIKSNCLTGLKSKESKMKARYNSMLLTRQNFWYNEENRPEVPVTEKVHNMKLLSTEKLVWMQQQSQAYDKMCCQRKRGTSHVKITD